MNRRDFIKKLALILGFLGFTISSVKQVDTKEFEEVPPLLSLYEEPTWVQDTNGKLVLLNVDGKPVLDEKGSRVEINYA